MATAPRRQSFSPFSFGKSFIISKGSPNSHRLKGKSSSAGEAWSGTNELLYSQSCSPAIELTEQYLRNVIKIIIIWL